MRKINNSGFTLVELLGVFAILSVIMLLAIPNVIGISEKNKNNTYIENAKQMISAAEYKFTSDTTIEKPNDGECIKFMLKDLTAVNFENGPEGKPYLTDDSFVLLANENSTYKYYVTLTEKDGKGLSITEKSKLNGTESLENIVQADKVDRTIPCTLK